MKIALLYFTGTGVTAKYADDITKGFLEEKHSVDKFRLKKGVDIDLSNYDIIGIGSPAYSFRIPWLVTRLLRKIDFEKKPFFVFCTSGGMPGNALWNLYVDVKRTGGKCIGDASVFGTTNLRSWMPKTSDKNHKLWGINDGDIKYAKHFASIIINNFNELQNNPSRKFIRSMIPRPSVLTILWTSLFTWRWMMACTVGRKIVDKDKCNNCGLCETKICSSRAITLTSDGYPKFNEFRCIGCNGCVNLCPEDAIWSNVTKNHIQYNLYKEYVLDR